MIRMSFTSLLQLNIQQINVSWLFAKGKLFSRIQRSFNNQRTLQQTWGVGDEKSHSSDWVFLAVSSNILDQISHYFVLCGSVVAGGSPACTQYSTLNVVFNTEQHFKVALSWVMAKGAALHTHNMFSQLCGELWMACWLHSTINITMPLHPKLMMTNSRLTFKVWKNIHIHIGFLHQSA